MRKWALPRRLVLCIAVLAVALASAACGGRGKSAYPSSPVTFVVPFSAGGPSDVNARTIAEHAKKCFSQPISVVNIPGGSATIGTNTAITSKPDGYTWLYGGTAELSSGLLIAKPPYTMNDYQTVLKIGNMAVVLLVKAEAPWQNLAELIAYAKAHPGEVKVGVPGEASVNRVTGEVFADAVGIQLAMVPFPGNSAVVTAASGGHITAGLVNSPDAAAHAKEGGDLRGLAVFSAQRVPAIKHIPTASEQGVNVTGSVSHYLVVPNKVPANVVKVIHDSIKKVLEDPAYVEATNSFAFQVEYKDGAAAKQELTVWYEKAKQIYTKLGMIK